ncbi:MAG: hypothetical protein ACO23R_19535 [bacterium]|jgi:hypothetical protein
MTDDGSLLRLLDAFTQSGTPLPALIGNKLEWQVTVLTAAMISNESLASSMTAEEMVDASINYTHVIQERLGYYQQNQMRSLERLLEK